MAKILCLETATTNCSVAIGIDGKLVAIIEENTPQYSHAEQLHVFIEKALSSVKLGLDDIDAIAVSMGPGSYTGLRIGVSAAKGLSFAAEKPLIAIPTLESLARQIQANSGEIIIALLDARRMEVYSEVFDHGHHKLRQTKAEVITETSFQDFRSYDRIYLVGPGAGKCEMILQDRIFEYFSENVPSALQMVALAENRFQQKDFEDVAYFEPFYLKDFILNGGQKKT